MGVPDRGGPVHRSHVLHGVGLRPRHRLHPRRPRRLRPLAEPRGILLQYYYIILLLLLDY